MKRMEMGYIFLGFVGLSVSLSVNGMTTIGGYDWKAVNPNVQGISMALIAVGVIRILREMQRAGGGDGSWQRRYERARSGADKMMRRVLPAHKVREVRMLAVAAAVCLGIAFMLGILSRADLRTHINSVGSFVVFGSTDPYMSPQQTKKVAKEMRDLVLFQ